MKSKRTTLEQINSGVFVILQQAADVTPSAPSPGSFQRMRRAARTRPWAAPQPRSAPRGLAARHLRVTPVQ